MISSRSDWTKRGVQTAALSVVALAVAVLIISKTIAEEHGGRLEYTEAEGHTSFCVVLPLFRQVSAA